MNLTYFDDLRLPSRQHIARIGAFLDRFVREIIAEDCRHESSIERSVRHRLLDYFDSTGPRGFESLVARLLAWSEEGFKVVCFSTWEKINFSELFITRGSEEWMKRSLSDVLSAGETRRGRFIQKSMNERRLKPYNHRSRRCQPQQQLHQPRSIPDVFHQNWNFIKFVTDFDKTRDWASRRRTSFHFQEEAKWN